MLDHVAGNGFNNLLSVSTNARDGLNANLWSVGDLHDFICVRVCLILAGADVHVTKFGMLGQPSINRFRFRHVIGETDAHQWFTGGEFFADASGKVFAVVGRSTGA